jgi:acetylornithine/succinyldiaminopimelate/putrescine aminotransferase
MNKFVETMRVMAEEVERGEALYHFEDDGEEYILMRNGVAVAGISHGYAEQNPIVKEAIEACFGSTASPN